MKLWNWPQKTSGQFLKNEHVILLQLLHDVETLETYDDFKWFLWMICIKTWNDFTGQTDYADSMVNYNVM